MDIQFILIAISILALILSLISLWKSSLTPFKLKARYSSPTFSLYKITPNESGGRKTWWIPSIDMGFTFHNLGKCSGEVTDVRIVGNLKSLNHERKCDFYAKWIVDFPKFEQKRFNRFEWLDSSLNRNWYPLDFA